MCLEVKYGQCEQKAMLDFCKKVNYMADTKHSYFLT